MVHLGVEFTGYQYRFAAENIGGRCEAGISPAEAGLEIEDDLFIDAGIEGRGHRLSLLDSRYKEVGIGMAEGSYSGDPTCYMLANDFAQSLVDSRSFVTGVVYDDANEDGQLPVKEWVMLILKSWERERSIQQLQLVDMEFHWIREPIRLLPLYQAASR